jgi:hypothetical protein
VPTAADPLELRLTAEAAWETLELELIGAGGR